MIEFTLGNASLFADVFHYVPADDRHNTPAVIEFFICNKNCERLVEVEDIVFGTDLWREVERQVLEKYEAQK